MKAHQIKKELKENKEIIINPNTEDNSTNEEFQKIIESVVAEKNEDDNINDNQKIEQWKLKKESLKRILTGFFVSAA